MQAYLCFVKTFSPEMTDPAARYVTFMEYGENAGLSVFCENFQSRDDRPGC